GFSRSGESSQLRSPYLASHVGGNAAVAALHLHLCYLGCQEPACRGAIDSAPRYFAVGTDFGISLRHHCFLHVACPWPGLGRRIRGGVCHLHKPGLEHGLQFLSIAPHCPRRSRRSLANVRPEQLEAILAPRCPFCHATTRMEHDGFNVRRMVLCRCLGSNQCRRHHRHTPWDWVLHSTRDRAARFGQRWLGDWSHARCNPVLRPAAISPSCRLGRPLSLRARRWSPAAALVGAYRVEALLARGLAEIVL